MESIKAGQVFNSQKQLCDAIEIEYKDSTNSRKSREKEFDRRFKWHKEKRKIVIDEIYLEVKEKIENRGKSEGSRNNYKGIYVEYIDVLLLQYLQQEELNLKDTCKIYTTNNKIAENTGIVNCNYRTAFNNREKFYNTVKKNFNIKKNTYCMFDVFDMIKTKIREIVKSSLDRLQKQEKLEYESYYFVYIPYTARIPTEDELEAINNAEEETMREMGVETRRQIDNNYKLYKEFNQMVLRKVQDEFDYIESIFKGYEISLWEDFQLKSDTEVEKLKAELNALVISSLKEKPCKYQEKAKKDEKVGNWFGVRCSSWKPWNFDRLSTKYVEHCYSFINVLCNLNEKNIIEKIKKCQNNKITRGLTKEQKEEQNDKILNKLLDEMDNEESQVPY